MVGYDENATAHLSSREVAMAGGTAAAITRCITQPLDVLKIRFQLQVEPITPHPNTKYWGLYQASHTIIKQEGFQALWKGHVPAQILSISYGLCQVAVFEKLTEEAWFLFPRLQGDKCRPLVHSVCATVAGTVACIISFPFDTIRTILVAQGNPKIYNGVNHALTSIFKTRGIKSLYQGLLPTVLQTAPYAGVQFGVYTLLETQRRKYLVESQERRKESLKFLVGAIAGMTAKTVVYPMDLAKKRMQMLGFENARQGFGKVFTCAGFINCIVKTARAEGFTALFKGFGPSLLKAGVTSSLYFCVYNNTCAMLLKISPQR